MNLNAEIHLIAHSVTILFHPVNRVLNLFRMRHVGGFGDEGGEMPHRREPPLLGATAVSDEFLG